MVLQGYTQGGEGYLGIAISWRPDDVSDKTAFVAPTQWLLAESIGLDQAFAHIEHDAYVASRDTDKGHRTGKANAGGPITFALYPTNGTDIWEAGYGFKGNVSAIASDTTTAIQNGTMTAPVAPTSTPSGTGGTLTAGVYRYAYTYVTDYGETTLGTPTAGDTLSGSTSSDAISVIAAGPPGTTARNVYRKKDAGAYGLVHTIADNTTTTWTDTGAVAGVAPPTVNTSIPSGVSVLALTTGDANYVVPSKGRPVLIDTGTNQEIRTVLKYKSGPKEVYVGLLGERDGRVITHTGAGTVVVAPACTVTRPIKDTDFSVPQSNLLPVVCAEESIGGKYSQQYRFGYVGKLELKASAAKVSVTSDIMFNKPRQTANGVSPNPSPTAFDDTDASLDDLSFEYQDGFLCIENDANSTGTAMLSRMDDGTEFELNLNNNLKEEAPFDGTKVKRFLPGAKRKLDVKLKTLNPANYPQIYDKFVSRDLDAQFFAQFALNTGTDSSPTWKLRSFYVPHVRYIKSQEVRGLTDTVGENVEGVARRSSGQEKIYIYAY